jgi:perosamine synthetase
VVEVYERLEQEFGKWAGVENVVGCASGTAALHLALEALRLPQGSEVICPDFNMIAVPRAISLAGLVPVFVDCRDDLLIDPGLVERAVTDDTAAVMAVHVYGRRCDLTALKLACQRHHLYLIEDAAEAHGLPAYPWSDAVCWSFFKNKHVHGEEGGVVAFRDPKTAGLARRLKNMGFTDGHDFYHLPRGMNYRLANCLAALVLDSLGKFDEEMARRRKAEATLDEACPLEWRMPARAAPWVFDIRIPKLTKERQDELVAEVKAAGVAARHGFAPMHLQTEFRHCRRIGGEAAEVASREIIYLPMREDSLAGLDLIRRRLS